MTTTTINFTKAMYNVIMTNAKECGGKFFAEIPLEMLTVDDAYQRHEMVTNNRIHKLKNNWDKFLYDALRVSPHPEEGMFYIINGYHRWCVLKEQGKETAVCEILVDLAKLEPTERRVKEADIFAKQSVAVERVSARQMHNANVLTGNPADVLIHELCKKYHISKEKITSFVQAKRIATKNINYLDESLNVICSTDWSEESTGFSDHVLYALEFIFEYHPDRVKDITTELIKWFDTIDPDLVLANGKTHFYMRKHNRICMALEIEHHLHQTIGLPRIYTSKKIGVKAMKENDKRIGA